MKREATHTTENTMNDAQNPAYLFQGIETALLTAIVNGSLDPITAARRELAARGLDMEGRWVGFKQAQELLGIRTL